MPSLIDKLKPLSPGQEEMLRALKDDTVEVVGLFGPTGSGKSLFSVLYGIDAVIQGKYRRLIISRPVVDIVTGRELTTQDLGPQYYEIASAYLKDILSGFIDWKKIEELVNEGKLLFADTHYLRGRTFDDSVIFLDDSQNVPPESSIEILMRIGRNSKFIIAGDPVFQKLHGIERDGATIIREVLLGEENSKVVDLGLKDIIRPGAKRGIRLMIEMKMRNRPLNDIEKRIIDTAQIYAPDADIITVVEFLEEKKKFEIKSENVPDALIIVKENYLGRLVGRGGERIQKIEEDTELLLRGVELTLDFTNLIRAVHPVSWIHKHIVDVDFEGPFLAIKVSSNEFGAFVGQRGFHVKFIDSIFKKLLGIGVKVYEVEAKKRQRGKRKR